MDGVLLVNKPPEITSYKVVEKIKRHLGLKKVGHGGTLDPFATGLLVILIGKATKTSRYLLNEDKEYEGVISLGVETDTFDIEGKVLSKKEVAGADDEKIKNIFASFLGSIEQKPPQYSAIKINGEKAYNLARKEKKVKIGARKVYIYDLSLKSIRENKFVSFYAKVSKGTYLRSLAYDIGKKLMTGAYLHELRRISSGRFDLKNAFELKNVLGWKMSELSNRIISMRDSLDFPEIVVKDKITEDRVKNGQSLTEQDFEVNNQVSEKIDQLVKVIGRKGSLLAIHRAIGVETRPEVVF